MVNDEIMTNPAYEVQPGDKVKYRGKLLKRVKNKVYILMNKPNHHVSAKGGFQQGELSLRPKTRI